MRTIHTVDPHLLELSPLGYIVRHDNRTDIAIIPSRWRYPHLATRQFPIFPIASVQVDLDNDNLNIGGLLFRSVCPLAFQHWKDQGKNPISFRLSPSKNYPRSEVPVLVTRALSLMGETFPSNSINNPSLQQVQF